MEALNKWEKHNLAKSCAAKKFGLKTGGISIGRDNVAVDKNGKRYRIMYRAPSTTNVDTPALDFDYILLVNLDDKYKLAGMWRLTVDQARKIFIKRPKFKKYQVTQNKFKKHCGTSCWYLSLPT